LPTEVVVFSPNHYPPFTELWNQAYPDLKRTELEMRLADLALTPAKPQRWIAEHDGVVVGFGSHEDPDSESFQPRTYQLHLFVAPEHRQEGIGTKLFEQVMNALVPLDPLMVRCWASREGQESQAGVRFLNARGFQEQMQTFHSSLETKNFDLTRLARYVWRLEKYGYKFRVFADLQESPERNRQCYELYAEVMDEIPSPEPPRLPSFADYEERITRAPEFFRGQFLALHRGEYVGLCILLPKGRTSRELYADTLGVRSNYRGRGIAQALSYFGIEYAQRNGYSSISADSFVENHKIQVLLENLGFADRRLWTLFAKRF
jgi:mycothiol synthase